MNKFLPFSLYFDKYQTFYQIYVYSCPLCVLWLKYTQISYYGCQSAGWNAGESTRLILKNGSFPRLICSHAA